MKSLVRPGAMGVILEHTLPRPKALIECDSVLDVGAGVRPMRWYAPKNHVCVEPFGPYRVVLRAAGYQVLAGDALTVLRSLQRDAVEAVYLLDVIEHMVPEVGAQVVELVQVVASRQAVIYTPYGFKAQDKDSWGYGGDAWQQHRSGWLPSDFDGKPGWATELYTPVDSRDPEGFFAVWTA